MAVLRRTPLTHPGFKKPPAHGFTDVRGNQTIDAPKNWPFGRRPLKKLVAKKVLKPRKDES